MTPQGPQQPQTTVSSSQPAHQAAHAAPAATPQQAAGGAPPAVDAAALQRQIDELKAQVGEKDRAAQFWYDRAAKGQAAEPKATAKPAEDDVDLLDLITTKGVKGLDELMAKRGYARHEDVETKVAEKAAQMSKEAELFSQYPELKKQDSEFFQATAREYGLLVKAGVSQALAMELAAERTELRFVRTGKVKTTVQQTEESRAHKEADRLARVKAQGGDRNNRAPVESDEGDEELTPEQEKIIAAMNISKEAYIKRAKEGVKMRGTR